MIWSTSNFVNCGALPAAVNVTKSALAAALFVSSGVDCNSSLPSPCQETVRKFDRRSAALASVDNELVGSLQDAEIPNELSLRESRPAKIREALEEAVR